MQASNKMWLALAVWLCYCEAKIAVRACVSLNLFLSAFCWSVLCQSRAVCRADHVVMIPSLPLKCLDQSDRCVITQTLIGNRL